jgi:hypothetical protein
VGTVVYSVGTKGTVGRIPVKPLGRLLVGTVGNVGRPLVGTVGTVGRPLVGNVWRPLVGTVGRLL